MAARQDQTLQIALIVFAILVVLLAATTYLFWKSSSDADKQIASLTQQKDSSDQAARNKETENQTYRTYIGVGESDNLEDVQKTVEEDMKRWGSNFEESQRTYRGLLEIIYEENGKIAAREAEAKIQARELSDRLSAIEAEKNAQIDEYKKAMDDAQADAAKQRNQFEEDTRTLEATKQELLENLDKQRTSYEAQITDINAKMKELTDKLTLSERAKQKLLDERRQSAVSFEVPDGRVSWVNQDGTVWIDLGSADALRPQVTFSVYDTDLQDPANAETKGSIEVTRILDEHLAEARITSDDSTNPILTGDKIYSQVWHQGQLLRFAFTGLIDIDGDGRSDLEQARDLVRINGGEVDAYLTDDGKIEGEMTVDTRYLVLGDFPEATTAAEVREGWNAMSEKAKTLGVETILLAQFLDQMGYVPQERTSALGTASTAGGTASGTAGQPSVDIGRNPSPTTLYRSRSPEQNPANLFRSRTPYRAAAPIEN
jgi:hypothetical protein